MDSASIIYNLLDRRFDIYLRFIALKNFESDCIEEVKKGCLKDNLSRMSNLTMNDLLKISNDFRNVLVVAKIEFYESKLRKFVHDFLILVGKEDLDMKNLDRVKGIIELINSVTEIVGKRLIAQQLEYSGNNLSMNWFINEIHKNVDHVLDQDVDFGEVEEFPA